MNKPALPACVGAPDTVVLGIPVPIPTAQPPVGQGLSEKMPRNLRELLASNLEEADFCEVNLRVLREVGLCLQLHDQNRQLVKISTIDGSSLDLLSDGEAPAQLDLDDPGTVFVELADATIGVVQQVARNGILVDGRARTVTQLLLPFRPEQCLPLEPPGDWCTPSNDTWLSAQVARALRSASPTRDVVAVGMYKRLVGPQDKLQAAAQVLAGNPVQMLSQPHLWFRMTSPPQRRMVEREACDRARELCANLEQARTKHIGQQGISQLLHCRDDLEGVRVLLLEVGAGQRLDAALAKVDAIAIEWLKSVPPTNMANDERLRRVALLDPLAWWAAPPTNADET